MYQIGSVVLISVFEWQIGYVVKHEHKNEGQSQKSALNLSKCRRYVKSNAQSIENCERNVQFTNTIILKLVNELPVMG